MSIVLTGEERHDMSEFILVFDQFPAEHDLEDAAMDRGYNSNHIRK